jgi:GMP synthase-like glutamine amidotransferase
MRIHCFQHLAFENPGTIIEWSEQNQHSLSYTYFYEREFTFPPVSEIDGLLVMGGYMNVDEEQKFPWLLREKEYIRRAVASGKRVIGICLGAQLIASALGNKVYPGTEKEIGFFPIQFTEQALKHPLFSHFSNPYTVFHWHGDTFDLPANAQSIASSAICRHQCYLIGDRVLGLQFHFEMTETIVEDMLHHDGHELEELGKYIQKAVAIRKGFHYLEHDKRDFFILLDKFFNS